MVVNTSLTPVGASAVCSDALSAGEAIVLGRRIGGGLHDPPAAEDSVGVGAALKSAGAQGNVRFYQPDKLTIGLFLEAFKGFCILPGEVCFPADAEVQAALLPQLDICGLVDLQQRVGHQLTSTYQ